MRAGSQRMQVEEHFREAHFRENKHVKMNDRRKKNETVGVPEKIWKGVIPGPSAGSPAQRKEK